MVMVARALAYTALATNLLPLSDLGRPSWKAGIKKTRKTSLQAWRVFHTRRVRALQQTVLCIGERQLTLHSSSPDMGRPDWDKLFQDLAERLQASNEDEGADSRKVGVFFCGNERIAEDLERCCKHNSTSTMSFHFHSEKF